MRHIKYITLLVAIAVLVFSFIGQQENMIVEVEGGKISGVLNEESGIHNFKGIPFAAPPIGDLRWKAPQPVNPWEGIKQCESFGPSPMQASPTPFMFWSEEFLIPKEPISEDCLYLNVWTKSIKRGEKLPVLVYIYGGGFRSGGAGCAIYDGGKMAKKGVVFVSINYRVGVFGFLAHPELTAESGNNTSGNYALLDMIAALQWVQKNIEAFGGDLGNVTIAGQSAGAFAVNYLTASPLAKGLFHKAIAQSGAAFLSSPLRPGLDLEGAEKTGLEYASQFGTEGIAELRAKTAEEIFKMQGGLSSPITDGYVIPESIMESYQNSHQNDVPVIIGWNKDDKVMGVARPTEIFKQQVNARFGEQADEFFNAYPAGTDEEAAQSQYDMSRDETFGSQMYTWGNVQSSTAKSDVYMYNFNRALPAYKEETAFGAFHSGEIVYAYDNLHTLDRPWEPIDQNIAHMMSDFWANFAKYGNPNGSNLPKWDAYNAEKGMVMILDNTTEQTILPDKDKMRFWEKYYASLDSN